MAHLSDDTILTFKRTPEENDNMSDWSMVWSTTHIPGMDMATGGGSTRRRKSGRRRLRIAALTLGCFLSMHVRVSAAALCGGYFVFLMLLILSVTLLANPQRHFEVYLGQWSLSGPGRAFRIIPTFDGIGIAICIHAILRAIICVVLAALGLIYILHCSSDNRLPFTYCRTMELQYYDGEERSVDTIQRLIPKDKVEPAAAVNEYRRTNELKLVMRDQETMKNEKPHVFVKFNETYSIQATRKIFLCNESYPNNYPPIHKTPPYNFFYVEVIHYRTDHSVIVINTTLLFAIIAVWVTLWIFIILERCRYGRMIWNNMHQGLIIIPWLWAALLIFCGSRNFFKIDKPLRNVFHIGGHKEILDFLTDSFVVSTYIHAAGLGSELIHGKGLNHFASGHIDQLLDGENMWHSAILVILSALCSGGASVCALTDYMHMRNVSAMQESTLWVFPMISKCTLGSHYGHLSATLLFLGLVFSYMTVAFVCLKSALHTIFEYKVKLVFVEQLIVALLMLACMGVSLVFATNAGLGLVESIDVFLAGIATPLICAVEMLAMLCVYQSRDFMSDMNISTEDNACSSRIGIMWQIVPFIHILLLIFEAVMIANSELPSTFVWVGALSVIIIVLAVPFRACYNAYHFMKPPKKQGAPRISQMP